MSYILDALRRADAERARGDVPGLHTPAIPVPAAVSAERRTASAPLTLLAGAALVVAALAAGMTWWVAQRSAPGGRVVLAGAAPTPSPLPSPAASPAAAVALPAQPAASSAAPVPAAPTSPPVTTAAPAPAAMQVSRPAESPAAPAAREKKPSPAVARAAPAEPAPPRPAREAARESARPSAPAPRTPDAAPAPTTAPTGTVFAQADLPEAVRAQLPVLKISGATYSSNPVYRMAIVNGQVLHEGDLAAPGLQLEKIEQGRTIWSFRGYRYGLASQ